MEDLVVAEETLVVIQDVTLGVEVLEQLVKETLVVVVLKAVVEVLVVLVLQELEHLELPVQLAQVE
jgi:hypothetical protein